MNITITQEKLVKALAAASKAVNSRGALPVLANVYIGTHGKKLRVAATNLELGITSEVSCKVEAEGALTVPARLLAELTASLPAQETVTLEADGAVLHLKTKQFNTHINGIEADEFPPIPEKTGQPTLTLPAATLKEVLSDVSVAISIDEARPVLAGVYLYTEAGKLVAVATDSYRLAERMVGLGATQKDAKLEVIVPARTIQEVIRILGDGSGEVAVYHSENQIVFAIDGVEVTSRLIEGKFPDYRQIIPANTQTELQIKTAELARLVKVASLFARGSAGGIKLSVNRGGHLAIHATTADVGDNESTAECVVTGEDAEVSLNARYLQEALAVITTPEVSFATTGKHTACVVRPLGKGAADYLYIIMPLRS